MRKKTIVGHIICFVVIVCLKYCNSDSVFLVNKYEGDKYFCVTDSPFALSWIIDDTSSSNDLHQVSRYLPKFQDFWKISKDQAKDWSYKKTFADEIILDRRWEQMKIYKTDYVEDISDKKSQLKFTTVTNSLEKDFNIPLSIRAEKEAHIFLCDGSNVTESNCYWFIIQGFFGLKSGIRKCPPFTIPSINETPIKSPCNKFKHIIEHSNTQYLSNKWWSHYRISKTNNHLALTYPNGTAILAYTDPKPIFNVGHMIIHSKNNVGLWKFHKIEYYHIKDEDSIQFEPPINIVDGSLCISMIVKMCKNCKIHFQFIDKDNSNNLIKQIFSSENSGWQQIKFHKENITSKQIFLNLTTRNKNDRNPFWNISDFSQCGKNGLRMIELNTTANCQLVSDKTEIISLNESKDSSHARYPERNKCGENEVSNQCILCSAFVDEKCDQMKICERYGESVICSCSAGYVINSETKQCDRKNNLCEYGQYGHWCSNKCSEYCINCNNVDGTCDGCTENYGGPKCDLPHITRFINAPSVFSCEYTQAKIEVINFDLSGQTKSKFYVVQYKDITRDKTQEWINLKNKYEIGDRQHIEINNLRPGLTYSARCVVVQDSIFYTLNNIPTVEFTTKCDTVTENDLTIKTSNDSAVISVIPEREQNICPFKHVHVEVNEPKDADNFFFKHLNYSKVQLEGLNPFENYKVLIKLNSVEIRKSFKTSEGIPGKVIDLNAIIQGSKVHLTWNEPEQINGELIHYIVKYRRSHYKACERKNIETQDNIKIITTKEQSVSFDAIPYTKSVFSVSAVNTNFEGHEETTKKDIPKSDFIYDDEIPEVNLSKPETRSITLQFSSIECTKMRGPLLIKVNGNCFTDWCRNITNVITYYDKKLNNILTDLVPFTSYTLAIEFCRSEKNCKNTVKKFNFQTKPTTPNTVEDLSVYSKSQNSISLRWKPPHPPTGILEVYKIDYSDFGNRISLSTNVTNSPCRLWPEFQCFTLTNLSGYQTYNIDIMAKNQVPANFGQQINIKPITKIERSKKPQDFTICWTLQNDLEISWQHPTEANGDIEYFELNIIPHINEDSNNTLREKLSVTQDTYKPVYHYTVNANKLVMSINYKITVSAFNTLSGEPAYISTFSPPDIPLFVVDPKFRRTNNTIEIETSKIKNITNGHTYNFFLLIPNNKKDSSTHPKELKQLETNFKIQTSGFKIAEQCHYINNTFTIKNNEQVCKNRFSVNVTSEAQNVTILLVHTDHNKISSYKFYTYAALTDRVFSEDNTGGNLTLLALLLLLLIIPAAIIIYQKRHWITDKVRKNTFGDHSPMDTEALEDQVPLAKTIKPKNSKIYSKKVAISDFEQYVKESLNNGELERQHALFPRGQTQSWDCGALKENKSKNRYTNLVAYDHTRVVLAKTKTQNSDYINANYIDGYNVPKAYIATQGPKISTTRDFWRMIWQENVRHIAMLANLVEGGKKKVEKYWPEMNETSSFDNILVYHSSGQVFADYEHRVFRVESNNETRTIHQYHFSSWPDHGVPLYSQSLVPFLRKLQTIPLSSGSPVVVHCSAGVGRTGTILLCDICLRMAAEEDAVDVLRTIQQLRDQRPNMVDNIQQYKLAHLVILEYLLGKKTAIDCKDLKMEVDNLIKSGEIKDQIRYLEETAWQDQAMKMVSKKDSLVVVKEKNRFQTIIPEFQGCIFLSHYPFEDETSTYINAVKVDCFRSPDRFIVTQQPMPNTVGDFWRLIHEKDVSVIVSLNDVNLKNKTCCVFWPQDDKDFRPVDYLTIRLANTCSLETHDLVDVHMHIHGGEEYRTVQIVSFKGWSGKTSCPINIQTFLSFWDEANAISRKSDCVVVTCFDGVTASGLYVALSFIIEKMKLEQICDVCQAVRAIRHNRSQFVQSEQQFEFLYNAALAYIDSFEVYANFN